MTVTDSAQQLARRVARAAADKHATDIVILDVSDRLALADCFVLATGSNERQISAIVDEVTERMAREGIKPHFREGHRDGRWVLIDFNGVVAHIQHADERVFYALDRLWGDCPRIDFFDDAIGSGEARVADPPDGDRRVE